MMTTPAVKQPLPSDLPNQEQPAVDDWLSNPIAPGSRYGRSFAETGQFPYYTNHIDGAAGIVTVVSDTLVSTVYINAARGGAIQVGISKLDIPPGALAQDTVISVGEPIGGVTMVDDGMLMVLLEPSGLSFSQPATLTIHYGDTGQYVEELLRVVAYNEQNGEWEPQQILVQDKQQNTVAVQTGTAPYVWHGLATPLPRYGTPSRQNF